MNNTVHDTKPQVRRPQDRRAKDNQRLVPRQCRVACLRRHQPQPAARRRRPGQPRLPQGPRRHHPPRPHRSRRPDRPARPRAHHAAPARRLAPRTAGAPAAAQRRGRTSLTPASGGRSSGARKGSVAVGLSGSCAGSRCVAGGVVSQAPIRRRASVRAAAMTMCPGTGLLSQMIERGAGAGSCRRSERARGLATLPSSRPRRRVCAGLQIGQQVVRRGSAACGRSRWWRSSSRGVSRCSSRWRRTRGTAWQSAPPGSRPTAATPSLAWRCARAGRSGPSPGPSGSARLSWPACGRCRTG